MNIILFYRSIILILWPILIGGFSTLAFADHAWSDYHWERSSNPIALAVYDSLSPDSNLAWRPFLEDAIDDWNVSDALDLSLNTYSGSEDSLRKCNADDGTIRVCSLAYGRNGWLGVAGINVSGNHITKAYTKLNDSYYALAYYDTPAWRAMVVCQEIGHDFGLGHQDENFSNANLDTCMDYTNSPESNQHPDNHDYEQLDDIYTHTDGGGGTGGGGTGGCFPPNSRQCRAKNNENTPPPAMNDIALEGPAQWGKLVERSAKGHQEIYELDFGHGNKILTYVTWVESRGPRFKRGH